MTIEQHAIIGDGRSAALVSTAGAIDWLCWPRFDSDPVFSALLDESCGGSWRIVPTGPCRVERRYVERTNVLQTRFRAPSGSLALTDLMTLGPEHGADPVPEHELIRRLACEVGEVEVEIDFRPRLRFGRAGARLRDRGPLGIRCKLPAGLLTLRLEATRDGEPAPAPPLRLVEPKRDAARARMRLRAGDVLTFSLLFDSRGPAVLPPLGARADAAIEQTLAAWRRWSARCTYRGPHAEAVLRSALLLRLLLYAPSGAIVAAPTTSLPERLGGDLNWDYRYCWLRDAAFSIRALLSLGYLEEARSFLGWLLHATRLTSPELRPLYDVYGRPPPRERELSWLHGYAGSQPVRVGNAARTQAQLDVYGEVIDAVAQVARREGRLDGATGRLLRQLGRYVCERWRDGDQGIWEDRGPPRSYTHSRVLCWVALDRLLELHDRGLLAKLDAPRIREEHARIREQIEQTAWSPRLESYVEALGHDTVDAGLLLLGWYGFADPGSPRLRGTYERVRQRLGAGGGLLHRNEQLRALGEGAFALCSFWAVEHLARGGGDRAEAEALLASLLARANDVGLYAEEIDPASAEALGNFPQAYTHVGLINAVLTVAERTAPRVPADRSATAGGDKR